MDLVTNKSHPLPVMVAHYITLVCICKYYRRNFTQYNVYHLSVTLSRWSIAAFVSVTWHLPKIEIVWFSHYDVVMWWCGAFEHLCSLPSQNCKEETTQVHITTLKCWTKLLQLLFQFYKAHLALLWHQLPHRPQGMVWISTLYVYS